jgi:hypothetical protein
MTTCLFMNGIENSCPALLAFLLLSPLFLSFCSNCLYFLLPTALAPRPSHRMYSSSHQRLADSRHQITNRPHISPPKLLQLESRYSRKSADIHDWNARAVLGRVLWHWDVMMRESEGGSEMEVVVGMCVLKEKEKWVRERRPEGRTRAGPEIGC